MQKKADQATDKLSVIRDVETEMNNLVASGMQKPADWNTMPLDEKGKYLDSLKSTFNNVEVATQKMQTMMDSEQDALDDLSNMGVTTVPTANSKFNFKKYSQLLDNSFPLDNDQNGQTNVTEVRQLLDGFISPNVQNSKKALTEAANQAFSFITDNYTNPNSKSSDPTTGAMGDTQQVVRDSVNAYFTSSDEAQKDQAAGVLSRVIFPQPEQTKVDVEHSSTKLNLSKIVEETNKFIRSKALEDAKKAKPFNLKTAQHQSIRNVILFDQDQVTKDQFTNQMISDWHLVERNKGFGLKLDNYYTADWEKVWRENVMDKYDPLYIERRFEVDKLVPVGNNYQLEPGEKRRPYLPEFSNIEARLEANRDKMNKERDYSPAEKGKVFNWKEAQLRPLPPISAPINPLDTKPLAQIFRCSTCGNQLELDPRTKAPVEGVCSKCKGNGQVAGEIKTAPDPIKLNASADLEKLAGENGGIFFQNGKFIVVAKKKKKEFDSYYEAKEFKQLLSKPQQPLPKNTQNLSPEEIARRKEVAQHADMLGIDG